MAAVALPTVLSTTTTTTFRVMRCRFSSFRRFLRFVRVFCGFGRDARTLVINRLPNARCQLGGGLKG